MKLIKFQPNPLELTFVLQHKSETDTLTQSITLKKGQDWEAAIQLPTTTSPDPNNAAKQLGELLFRLSQAIMAEDGNFSAVDLANIELDNHN